MYVGFVRNVQYFNRDNNKLKKLRKLMNIFNNTCLNSNISYLHESETHSNIQQIIFFYSTKTNCLK